MLPLMTVYKYLHVQAWTAVLSVSSRGFHSLLYVLQQMRNEFILWLISKLFMSLSVEKV